MADVPDIVVPGWHGGSAPDHHRGFRFAVVTVGYAAGAHAAQHVIDAIWTPIFLGAKSTARF